MITDMGLFKTLLDNLHEGVYFVDRERRIEYWNKGAERITGYTSADVVGRSCSDNLLVHVDDTGQCLCLTSCPLSASIKDSQDRHACVFLKHKEGHRVPVRVSVAPILDGAGNIVGGLETFHDDSPLQAAIEELKDLKQLSSICPLTGVGNRGWSETMILQRLAEAQRNHTRIGLLFVDVDHFKRVNDTYGHAIGDVVLKMVARTLKNALRSYDYIGRWGGEEFVIVLPGLKPLELGAMAERLRALVEQSSRQVSEDKLCVTVSIGAVLSCDSDTLQSIVTRADHLMYESKSHGRNRVTLDTGVGRHE